jgi:hypothetical protein
MLSIPFEAIIDLLDAGSATEGYYQILLLGMIP